MKRIALIIEMSNEYGRGILRGIHQYAHSKNWVLYLTEHGRHEIDHTFAENWKGDGVIARIESEQIAEVVRKLQIPAIDVSAARLVPDIPWVETDDKAIIEMAVDHLLEKGLHNLAFFGDPFYNWSQWRCWNFQKILSQKKLKAHCFNLPKRDNHLVRWDIHKKEIHRWLTELPKPVGIVACYDMCGQQLLEICHNYSLSVPDEISVIGVDDDSLICELATPSLTSVIPDSFKAGFEAASRLDSLMNEMEVTHSKCSISPLGVHERNSTDFLAINDPEIAKAVRIIKKNVKENIQVVDLLGDIPLSRRIFERRFKEALNRTPHQVIIKTRMDHIRNLLVSTQKTLSEIAEEMNFEHPEYMCVLFKKETGMTPTEYRKKTLKHTFL